MSDATNEATLRGLILDNMTDGAVAIDRTHTILFANRSLCSKTGYERDGLLGRPIHILVPNDLEAVHSEHVNGFFGHPGDRLMARSGQLPVMCRDKSKRKAQIALSYHHHPVLGLIGVAILRWIE